MDSSKLDGIRAENRGTLAGGGHDEVTRQSRSTAAEHAAPAFSAPMVWVRVEEYLRRSGIFPPQADLTVQEVASDAILINCSWPLLEDPEQPDRRSTPIEIVIHGDLADQFHHADSEALQRLNEALARVVAQRMKRYQADHGLPYHRPPPTFEIRLNLGMMGWFGQRRKQQAA